MNRLKKNLLCISLFCSSIKAMELITPPDEGNTIQVISSPIIQSTLPSLLPFQEKILSNKLFIENLLSKKADPETANTFIANGWGFFFGGLLALKKNKEQNDALALCECSYDDNKAENIVHTQLHAAFDKVLKDTTNTSFIHINIREFTDTIMKYSPEKVTIPSTDNTDDELPILPAELPYQKFNEILYALQENKPVWLDLSVFDAKK